MNEEKENKIKTFLESRAPSTEQQMLIELRAIRAALEKK